jgi:hypothetical protein
MSDKFFGILLCEATKKRRLHVCISLIVALLESNKLISEALDGAGH